MAAHENYKAMQAALEAQMQGQGQSAGLRMLRQIMMRLMKGELGFRLEIWRTACKDAQRASDMASLQADLQAQAADATRGVALRQLRQIMVHIMKGEVAMRIEVWRTSAKVEATTRNAEMQAALEAFLRIQGQGASLRQLRQIMARFLHYTIMLLLQNWRLNGLSGVLSDGDREAKAMKAALQAKMRMEGQGAGLRMLKQIMFRMVKGEIGMRLMIWRSATQADAQDGAAMGKMAAAQQNAAIQQLRRMLARIMHGVIGERYEIWRAHTQQANMSDQSQLELARLKAALEGQLAAQGQGAGLRMLRQVLARQVKGELGMRMEIWKMAVVDDKHATQLRAMQKELERSLSDTSSGAGLRALRQVFARIMKGELGLRIEVWRTAAKMAAMEEFQRIQAELEAKMRSQGQSAGLKQLQLIMMRMVKGEVGMRLHIWRMAVKEANANSGDMVRLEAELQATKMQLEMLQAGQGTRLQVGLKIMVLQAERMRKTAMLRAAHTMRINFFRANQSIGEAAITAKMARFTTASLAMQARLEERLHNHSQQTAFGVLSRFLRQDQQASQKASPELVVATWARQAGIGGAGGKLAMLAAQSDMNSGLRLMQNFLKHGIRDSHMKVVITWNYAMRTDRNLLKNRMSAVEGVQFAHAQGMKTLRNLFKLMLRGEVGLRMFLWRKNIANEKDAKYREIRIKYEAQSRHFSQLFRR